MKTDISWTRVKHGSLIFQYSNWGSFTVYMSLFISQFISLCFLYSFPFYFAMIAMYYCLICLNCFPIYYHIYCSTCFLIYLSIYLQVLFLFVSLFVSLFHFPVYVPFYFPIYFPLYFPSYSSIYFRIYSPFHFPFFFLLFFLFIFISDGGSQTNSDCTDVRWRSRWVFVYHVRVRPRSIGDPLQIRAGLPRSRRWIFARGITGTTVDGNPICQICLATIQSHPVPLSIFSPLHEWPHRRSPSTSICWSADQ